MLEKDSGLFEDDVQQKMAHLDPMMDEMMTMKTSVEEKLKKFELKKLEAQSEITLIRCEVLKLSYREKTHSISLNISWLLFAVVIIIMKYGMMYEI